MPFSIFLSQLLTNLSHRLVTGCFLQLTLLQSAKQQTLTDLEHSIYSTLWSITLPPGNNAKYCNKHVCLSVQSHILKTTCQDITKQSGWGGIQTGCRCICLCYLSLHHKIQKMASSNGGSWSEFCITVGTATRTAGILTHSQRHWLLIWAGHPANWLCAGLIGSNNPRWLKADFQTQRRHWTSTPQSRWCHALQANFLLQVAIAVAQSSSNDNAIRYVLPVL